MSEVVRAVEGPEQAIAGLQAKVDALESTVLTRLDRRATGTPELAFRATPKPGTLFMQGQTYQKTEYPALWKFASENGWPNVTATAFTLPDMRGKTIIGVGPGSGSDVALGAVVGAATVTLSTAQMPVHAHTGSSSRYEHDHSGISNFEGGHGGHVGSQVGRTTGADFAAHPNTTSVGDHRHGIPADGHEHTLTINNAGSGAAHENRQPSMGWHLAVWHGGAT